MTRTTVPQPKDAISRCKERAASLGDFEQSTFTHGNTTRTIYLRGTGPGVIIMHELPGLTPGALRLGYCVAEAGFTAVLPLLFGTPGPPSPLRTLKHIAEVCIRREIYFLAKRQSSPLTDWLRALCRDASAKRDGQGVGVIGMCLTGGFALALMADEFVMAPVVSQPSLPLPLTPGLKEALGVSPEHLAAAKVRASAGCPLLGLRFHGDWFCPEERFDTLRREFPDSFEAIEIDPPKDNRPRIRLPAHAVLTEELKLEDGHPTHEALERVLVLLRERLLTNTRG